jgi:putative transposase
MERIPVSEKTRKRLNALLRGEAGESEDLRSAFLRLATQLLIEEGLEEEVEDLLGRDYYERGTSKGRGYRNGYRTGRLKSAEGEIRYGVPQVSDRDEPFRSRIRAILSGRTEELENLAVQMYARGLSTRDIEGAFSSPEGRLLLSRTAVSRITERIWESYEAFATRDLSETEILYLFVDGIAERLHPSCPREAVLCAWGYTWDGTKVLVHLAPGTKEDTDSCRAFFEDLKRRGLPDPLLVTTDGAPGLIRAVEECFPRSARQRCLVHRMRNLQSKVPDPLWPEFKERVRAVYQAPSASTAHVLAEELVRLYQADLPSAVSCFQDDFDACIAHLEFPVTHRKTIRTTNFLERLFLEERRRTKVIPHAFGEKPLLKLMYASILLASETWRNLSVSEFESRKLESIRLKQNERFEKNHTPVIVQKPSRRPVRFSSKKGT